MTVTDFEASETTKDLLIAAKKIIEDEWRWTEGYLFEGFDLKVDPLCNNVKVCARGALALAAFGSEAVKGYEWYDDNESPRPELADFCTETVAIHPKTAEASDLLDRAAREVSGAPDVVCLNDNGWYGSREKRYTMLLESFDYAVTLAGAEETSEVMA